MIYDLFGDEVIIVGYDEETEKVSYIHPDSDRVIIRRKDTFKYE